MPKYSLRGRVIERWEEADCPQWDYHKTRDICLEEDHRLRGERKNPARRFREEVEMKNEGYIKKWVMGCHFPWLNPKEPKGSIKQHKPPATDPMVEKIGDETLNQNGQLNVSSRNGFVKEQRVREILEKEYAKTFYTKKPDRTLCVGRRSTGDPINHEFDLVSEDRTIIGEVKSYKHTKKAHANTRLPRIVLACKYLEMIQAEKKVLVFTNEEMHRVMKHALDGLVSSDIEIMYINLGKA